MKTKIKLTGKDIEKQTIRPFEDSVKNEYKTKNGWYLISSKGFPDYILYNKKTKETIFYELKANNHQFHPFQKQLIKILINAKKRSGEVLTYHVNKKTKKTNLLKKEDAIKKKVRTNKSSWEKVEDIGIL